MATDLSLNFEATELRLGPPGNGDSAGKGIGKRGFSETVDLKLNLMEPAPLDVPASTVKDTGVDLTEKLRGSNAVADPAKPPAHKAQVVGWPPVRSFRRNMLATQSSKGNNRSEEGEKNAGATYVKVSMDGAPYLRKVDLNMYKSYQDLSNSLEKMFSCFTMGQCGSQGINFLNESKLMDLLNGSEYVPTYEDRDGDWMLVGDVPWEMFVDSCRRLRIMKGSEAIGLAPRAVEKCKNRS
ncbi:auxin-responsive protein IAA16 [Amborella trichopoda]|uniref:Auxin-responsive protein n=1 Tax=Amborella trichopoda TaxID=13333 RepID=W1P1I6_AMBTC|nr:auxin-responsive protein IAA16 [Amborella trichopoda]ERN01436.1 hypothetical protein AMTR_s00002p00266760 [Amborella trichopoda]|eukprot:XP_006838867.1 auxin-responsive protein IAA16 [Amborella trichopoda]